MKERKSGEGSSTVIITNKDKRTTKQHKLANKSETEEINADYKNRTQEEDDENKQRTQDNRCTMHNERKKYREKQKETKNTQRINNERAGNREWCRRWYTGIKTREDRTT